MKKILLFFTLFLTNSNLLKCAAPSQQQQKKETESTAENLALYLVSIYTGSHNELIAIKEVLKDFFINNGPSIIIVDQQNLGFKFYQLIYLILEPVTSDTVSNFLKSKNINFNYAIDTENYVINKKKL